MWHNGKRQENRDGIVEALEAVGSRLKRKVVVLQPRVRRVEYEHVREMLSKNNNPTSTGTSFCSNWMRCC